MSGMPLDREAAASFTLVPILAIAGCALIAIVLSVAVSFAAIRNAAAGIIGIASILAPEALVAYAPSAGTCGAVLAVMAASLLGGFFASRLGSRIPAWALGAVTVGATLHFVDREPAGVRMLAIVAVLLLAMKAIVARDLTFKQWLAFVLWLGMRPSIFATLGGTPRDGSARLAIQGLRNLIAGAAFVVSARLIALTSPPIVARFVATPLLLVGLSLMLHFGFLNLLASFWRARGVPAERLFRDPLRATSPADFWSHRWNVGFAEMTALVIHRPIRAVAGRKVALLTSFLVSGLLHELAISVPVRAGYGLPTLYFALQGLVVASGTRSRWVMFLGLLAPLLLVFHLPFLRAIIWPLAGIR